MTTYPFKQGIDYGPRQGSLGLGFHMSEGGDGLVAYLAKHASETNVEWRNRVRGVSINAAILSDGTIWQMVAWDHATGSFNPADRNPATTGYYNGQIIKDVLGSHYTDPNTWTVTTEIAGYRVDGPTDKQVVAAVKWGLDMRAMFPSIRGAFGHHDQTDTKGCPGETPNMKAIFEGVGGHGLFTEEPEMTNYRAVGEDWTTGGAPVRLIPDRTAPAATTIPSGSTVRTVAEFQQSGEAWRVTRLADGRTGFLIRGDLAPVTPGGDPAVDAPFLAYVQRQPVLAPLPPDAVSCKPFSDAAVKTAVAEDRAKSYVAWKP